MKIPSILTKKSKHSQLVQVNTHMSNVTIIRICILLQFFDFVNFTIMYDCSE